VKKPSVFQELPILGILHAGHRVRHKHFESSTRDLSLDGKRILDAGCGQGAYSLWLASRYPTSHIVALDLDPTAIDIAKSEQRAKQVDNVTFAVGDLANLSAECQYDLVCSIDVMEHIPNDTIVFRNIYRALAQGGEALIHVPLQEPRRFWGRFRDYTHDPSVGHIREGYKEQELLSKLEQQGFRICKKRYTFGWAGELAWELYKLFERSSKLFRLLIHPAVMILSGIEVAFPVKRGNGLLLRADKAEAAK
jgi:SAM-dependent methyltransferase